MKCVRKLLVPAMLSTALLCNVSFANVKQATSSGSGFYTNVGLGYLYIDDFVNNGLLDKVYGEQSSREKYGLDDQSAFGSVVSVGYQLNRHVAFETGLALSLTSYKYKSLDKNDSAKLNPESTRVYNIYLMPKVMFHISNLPITWYIKTGISYTRHDATPFYDISNSVGGFKKQFISLAYGAGMEYDIKQIKGLSIGLGYLGFYSHTEDFKNGAGIQNNLKLNTNYFLVNMGYKF